MSDYTFNAAITVTAEQLAAVFDSGGTCGCCCAMTHPGYPDWETAFADPGMRLRAVFAAECEQTARSVTHKMIQRGLQLYARQHMDEFHETFFDGCDGLRADRVIQLIALGEERYG